MGNNEKKLTPWKEKVGSFGTNGKKVENIFNSQQQWDLAGLRADVVKKWVRVGLEATLLFGIWYLWYSLGITGIIVVIGNLRLL